MAKKTTEPKAPAAKKPRALKGNRAVEVDVAPAEVAAVASPVVEIPAVAAITTPEILAAPVELPAPLPVPASADRIRARAYEIWRAEGGSALENWLRAERELNR